MFDSSYKVVSLGHTSINSFGHIKSFKYRFKSDKKLVYIIDIDYYDHFIFVPKFYLSRQQVQGSCLRYGYLTNSYEPAKVINTVICVLLEILQKFPKASIGFIGSPTTKNIKSGSSEKIEQEKSENTKRYQVYKKITTSLFSHLNFHHTTDKNLSTYLLINKVHPDPKVFLTEIAIPMLSNIYPDLNSFLD